MICTACKGSGITPQPFVHTGEEFQLAQVKVNGTACKACDGTGYRSNRLSRDRHEHHAGDIDSIGKVIQYNPGRKLAKLALEETLHVGSKLMIMDANGETEFELQEMVVSKMNMSMALAGWEVVILVPKDVNLGTKVYRIGA